MPNGTQPHHNGCSLFADFHLWISIIRIMHIHNYFWISLNNRGIGKMELGRSINGIVEIHHKIMEIHSPTNMDSIYGDP